ncbi:MAG: DNA-3-methyladenine glycosylase family protein [Candidatus Binatia bacterium]
MKRQFLKRKDCATVAGSYAVGINLPFKSPYDWPAILRFFQSHSIPGIERVTETYFERLFRLKNTIGLVRVGASAGKPELKVTIAPDDLRIRLEVIGRVRKMFDLDCDPEVIAESFARIPLLGQLCGRFPGLRLARGWDPFETAICSILGQLVSAAQRSNLIGQLVRNYGEEVAAPAEPGKVHLFPSVEVLARSDLQAVKTTIVRREAIRDFSRRVLSGAVSFSETQAPAAFRKSLLDIKGLGPWSAEYISLRAIGDRDAFPQTDLILKRALALHPDLDLEQIRPWRSYAATYLWKEFAQILSRHSKEKQNAPVPHLHGIPGR